MNLSGLSVGDTLFAFTAEQQVVLSKYLAGYDLLNQEIETLYRILEQKNNQIAVQDSLLINADSTRQNLENIITNNNLLQEENIELIEEQRQEIRKQRTQKRVITFVGILGILAALIFG